MKVKYVNKAGDVQELDTNLPDYERRRDALTTGGYEVQEDEAKPGESVYRGGIAAPGVVKDAKTGTGPQNIPVKPILDPSAPMRPEGDMGASGFLEKFKKPLPITAPTAAPVPTPLATRPPVVTPLATQTPGPFPMPQGQQDFSRPMPSLQAPAPLWNPPEEGRKPVTPPIAMPDGQPNLDQSKRADPVDTTPLAKKSAAEEAALAAKPQPEITPDQNFNLSAPEMMAPDAALPDSNPAKALDNSEETQQQQVVNEAKKLGVYSAGNEKEVIPPPSQGKNFSTNITPANESDLPGAQPSATPIMKGATIPGATKDIPNKAVSGVENSQAPAPLGLDSGNGYGNDVGASAPGVQGSQAPAPTSTGSSGSYGNDVGASAPAPMGLDSGAETVAAPQQDMYSYFKAPAAPAANPMGDIGELAKADRVKSLSQTTQEQEKAYDPAAMSTMVDSANESKRLQEQGLADTQSEMADINAQRYSRAARLAEARGAAFDNYTKGLNENEKNAFMSAIINSLGKILVGGFDLMTGPKTAGASQYYKDPTPFDKKEADALEKQKYDTFVKMEEDIEQDQQGAEDLTMKNRKALEDMRGKVSDATYAKAKAMVELSEKVRTIGMNMAGVTNFDLAAISEKRNEAALDREFKLKEAAMNNAARAVAAKINGEAYANKVSQGTEKKVVKEFNPAELQKTAGKAAVAQTVMDNVRVRNAARDRFAVSGAEAAYKAYKASPTPANAAAYQKSLVDFRSEFSSYLVNNAYEVFTGKEGEANAGPTKEMVTNYVNAAISGKFPNHPLLVNGLDGMKDLSRFYSEQLALGSKSPLANESEINTDTANERKDVGWKDNRKPAPAPTPTGTPTGAPTGTPSASVPAKPSATPTPLPRLPAKPGATPTAKPGLPAKPVAPKPAAAPTPSAKPDRAALEAEKRELLKQIDPTTRKGPASVIARLREIAPLLK
jgi:hypothetical protein